MLEVRSFPLGRPFRARPTFLGDDTGLTCVLLLPLLCVALVQAPGAGGCAGSRDTAARGAPVLWPHMKCLGAGDG